MRECVYSALQALFLLLDKNSGHRTGPSLSDLLFSEELWSQRDKGMNPGACYWKKGDPFQGLRVDSCLTPGNELSKETHVLIKQKTLLGRGAKAGEQQGREARRAALPRGSQS